MKAPLFVLDREGHERGTVIGFSRLCRLEGCGGRRYTVRWPDGRRTIPCARGMKQIDIDTWQIE